MSANSDIQRLSVFMPQIVQHRPKFAVYKGALSISNSPFNAIAASSSQLTFNVQVPSLNVFLNREVELTGAPNMRCRVQVPAAQPVQPTAPAVLTFGQDCALPAFPLHQMFNTLTATINDTTSTINVNDVLYEVLRLVDMKRNRLQRTCPTMLDKYQAYDYAVGAINNNLASYWDGTDYDNMPNGSFHNVVFTDAAGVELQGSGTAAAGTGYADGRTAGSQVDFNNGVPCLTDGGWNAAPAVGPATGVYAVDYNVYYRYQSTEKLVLSPFIFSEVHGNETALFGINNIQLVVNVGATGRNLRVAPLASGNALQRTVTLVQFQNTAWQSVSVNCQFYTPSLDLDLPPKSVVPYMEYPRYISANLGNVAANGTATLRSNTITLPQIPDMLIIYCRPQVYQDNTRCDWYLPITNISMNFDNFSGLLSSHTAEQLYAMSVDNGLDMDWNTWNGQAIVANNRPVNPVVLGRTVRANRVPAVGGFLVLKPSKDIPLQSGQAPSVVGNYTLQFNATVYNQSGGLVAPSLYVIAVNSGFFETQSGSSRILKGVLNEQQVISAPRSMDSNALRRYVGGNFLSSLGNALSKVASNPAVQRAAKGAIKGAMGSGVTGGVGASVAGAGRKSNLQNLL